MRKSVTAFTILSVLMLSFAALYAQSYGTIRGKVIDAQIGEGLAGVNVFLVAAQK